MTATALDIARERQLDWLLDEVLCDRHPHVVRREARGAVPRWLAAALVVLAIGAAVGVALHDDEARRSGPTPVQDPAPDPAPPIEWHECKSPAELDAVPADVEYLRGYDFDDDAVARLVRFTTLTHLDLSKSMPDARGVTRSVRIGDAGVSQLGNLSNLRWLSLAGCSQVRGKTLGQLRAIPQLEHLDLSYTGIRTSAVESLGTLPSLRELVLSGCREFHGSAIAEVARLPGLRRLELASCISLSADDVKLLRNLSELRHLDLSGCMGAFLGQTAAGFDDLFVGGRQEPKEKQPVQDGVGVTDAAVAALRDLPIETLLLHGCRSLTDDVAGSLAAMKRLRKVDLGNLPRTSTAILKALPTNLKGLSLHANHHYDAAGLDALQRFGELTSLDISGLTAIDDARFARILAGKRLTTLKLGGTPRSRDAIGARGHYLPAVTARCVATIALQPFLEELDLKASEWLDRDAARRLAQLPNLHELRLVWCKSVDSAVLKALQPLPLTHVDLYGIGATDADVRGIATAWRGCAVRLPKGARVTVPPR
ncbi:MAG: leucine-rich repeat domain-containing protein [Planctomycetota bacterium]